MMSYFVSRRTSEIGIRMAMGARSLDVLKLILGHGMMLTICGVGIGLLAALLATRLIVSLLFGVSAIDPITYVSVATFLILIALVACCVPTLRAIRVDPLIAIREQ